MTANRTTELLDGLRSVGNLHEFAELFGFNWEDDSDWTWHDVAVKMADELEQAIAATLGSGALTAEQVQETVEKHWHDLSDEYDMPEATALPEYSYDWQAIADELNSRAERTCKQEERGWGTEGDHARVWLTCGHDCMVPTVQDLPNYCPNCGARVKDVGE